MLRLENVEEAIDTAVWGTKMAFDVGDTREKFDETINESGGMANYLGEQGVMLAGGFFLRRVGVKNRHDSGGDGGGSPKKAEGTPKAPNVGSVIKDGNKTKYTNLTGNELAWVDQHPKNINRDIDNSLNSKDPGKATEAKVASAVRENKEVTGYGQKIQRMDNSPAGDLDVVTKDEIIEVKKSLKAVTDVEQFDKYVNVSHTDYFNPDQKKVILYIEKSLTNLHPNDLKKIEAIKSKGVIIINSLDELKEVLK